MMLKKHEKKYMCQQTIELTRLLSASEDIYWNELEKSENCRDNILISECLETMKYVSAALSGGARCVETQTCASRIKVSFARKLITGICALVLALMLSVGVAYAAGIDVWKTLITGEVGYMNIVGESHNDNSGIQNIFPTSEAQAYLKYDTVDEACADLNFKPLMFDLTNRGLIPQNILGAMSSASISLVVDYMSANNDDYFYYAADVYPDVETAFNKSVAADGDNIEKYVYNGIEHYVSNGGDEIVVLWAVGNTVYQVNTNLKIELLYELLSSLYTNN